MVVDIHELLDQILEKFKEFNPIHCRSYDDPRIDTYYIAIKPNIYIVIEGLCDCCDYVSVYKNNTNSNIMTLDCINRLANDDAFRSNENGLYDCLYEFNSEEIMKYDGNLIDELYNTILLI